MPPAIGQLPDIGGTILVHLLAAVAFLRPLRCLSIHSLLEMRETLRKHRTWPKALETWDEPPTHFHTKPEVLKLNSSMCYRCYHFLTKQTNRLRI